MTTILLADNQDITYAGLTHLCHQVDGVATERVTDKRQLLKALAQTGYRMVILDYTLFDINGAEELLILGQRFRDVVWLLFSEDLSTGFLRQILTEDRPFNIVMKESSMAEIREAIHQSLHGQRYICQRVTEILSAPDPKTEEKIKLTKTETEVLKDIALGLTTKEIAGKRFSSFHTVNTHRKNIFRKLHVNNVHEATKYALRAGLIDAAEYYI